MRRLSRSSVWLVGCLLAGIVSMAAGPVADASAATITLKPASVPQGGKTKVVGAGFVPADILTIALDGTPVATATVTATGTVAKIVKVPLATTVGGHTIAATGALGGTASAPVAVTPGYRISVLDADPVAYYRLSDRGAVMTDASGSGRHAVYSTAGNVKQRVGGALLTDPDKAVSSSGGANPVGGLAAASFLPAGNAPRSIEAWYKSTNALQHGLVAWGTTGRGRAFGLAVLANRIWLDTYQGIVDFSTTKNLKDGKWHHLVITWDGTNGRGYVDGKPLAIVGDSVVRPLVTVSEGLLVGAWVDTAFNQRLVGTIDEVAIYDRVLTPAEVAAHVYAAGRK
jgi:hypothetical protein